MPRTITDWLRLNEAALYYYKQTGHKVPNKQTLRNWIVKGKRDYTGKIIRLEGIPGRVYLTRKRWVDEFIERMKGPEITFNGVVLDYDTELPA